MEANAMMPVNDVDGLFAAAGKDKPLAGIGDARLKGEFLRGGMGGSGHVMDAGQRVGR